MKCILNPASGEVVRVDDTEAHYRVSRYGWRYVPKSEFKAWVVENAQRKAVLNQGRR